VSRQYRCRQGGFELTVRLQTKIYADATIVKHAVAAVGKWLVGTTEPPPALAEGPPSQSVKEPPPAYDSSLLATPALSVRDERNYHYTMAEQLHKLKRKRTRERGNITRFSDSIYSFTVETARDDYEHYKGRLEETLEQMLKLDDAIHDFLTDEE